MKTAIQLIATFGRKMSAEISRQNSKKRSRNQQKRRR